MKPIMLKMWQNALTSMLKKVNKWKTTLFGINLLTKNKQSWAKILKKNRVCLKASESYQNSENLWQKESSKRQSSIWHFLSPTKVEVDRLRNSRIGSWEGKTWVSEPAQQDEPVSSDFTMGPCARMNNEWPPQILP